MPSLIKEFREFILRGNLVDLAVAVVIGAAFTAVVNAFVKDIVTPVIAAIGGEPDFSDLKFTINGSQFAYGDFLNNLLAFVLIAAAIFFLVVTPINWLMSRRAQEDPDTKQCPECDTAIPVKARRCPQCTTRLSGGPDAPARPGSVAAP